MSGRHELEVRTDLADCAIDVCSVDVPALFTENFDYQDLRTDFVHGILTSDLLGKQIFCHIPKHGYAARVRDTRSYAEIRYTALEYQLVLCSDAKLVPSYDVLSRRTFPLVPDDTPAYELKRGLVYIGESVFLSRFVITIINRAPFVNERCRSCTLKSRTQVGPRSHVDDNAIIEGSVIGPGCRVGPNVKIVNCFMMSGSAVGANSIITETIIGCEVKIGPNSRVDRGCMIGDGAILGTGANVPPFSKVAGGRPPPEGVLGEEGPDLEAPPK